MKLALHKQNYDETFAKTITKIKPLLVQLWLSEVHVCWIYNWIHTSSQLCSLVTLEVKLRPPKFHLHQIVAVYSILLGGT